MKIAVVGGGPAGLYSALLIKKARFDWDVTVYERNPPGATYGWGVVFSDRTLSSFREADYRSYVEIVDRFVIWDAIEILYRGEVLRCEGQGFSGIARKELLGLLQRRCDAMGVNLRFETEVQPAAVAGDHDLVIAADGVNSIFRGVHAETFRPSLTGGRSRYIWFGTNRPLGCFTFMFRETEAGLFQVHSYPFDGSMSTFIVECDETTWANAGLADADEAASIAFCEAVFDSELGGHSLRSNNSKWVRFATVRNKRWRHDNIVLMGDAAHTAHFSIGSGTKLAMEDAIALANALKEHSDLDAALADYELDRRPRVERFQQAAAQSQTYFENTARYLHLDPVRFSFHLMTRSGRVDYGGLRTSDHQFVAAVDRRVVGEGAGWLVAAPPAFSPLGLGGLEVGNRVAVEVRGAPDEDALAAAAGSGAALVVTGIAAVAPEGRITPNDPRMDTDEDAAGWTSLVRGMRKASTARIAVRIGHAGRRGACRPRTAGVDRPLERPWDLIAPSADPYTRRSPVPRAMEAADFELVAEQFAVAAHRAAGAGFDALIVDMARGYLLGSFLSPLANRRTDSYGGDLGGRMRFPLEVFERVRARWPSERALGVALSARDWSRHGQTLDDSVAVARELRARGCDFIEVRAGGSVADERPLYDPYYWTSYSDRIRGDAAIETMATGPIISLDQVNTIVGGGRAGLCLLLDRR